MYRFFVWLTLIVGELAWLGIFGYYVYGYVQAFINDVDYKYPYKWMGSRYYSFQSLNGWCFLAIYFGWAVTFIAAFIWPLTYIVGGAVGTLYYLRVKKRNEAD